MLKLPEQGRGQITSGAGTLSVCNVISQGGLFARSHDGFSRGTVLGYVL